MEEERVVHLLHELPLQRASAGFTTRVLRRLDETPASRQARQTRLTAPRGLRRLDRLMVATATVAALGLSITLLQRERAGGPLAAGLASAPAATAGNASNASTIAARAVGGRMAAALQGRPERRQSPLPLAYGASPAAGPAALQPDFVQARAELRQLRQESGRLERDLHSLRGSGPVRSAAAPPSASAIYLGGDESVDLVVTPARIRARQPAPDPADRDDGELNYSL